MFNINKQYRSIQIGWFEFWLPLDETGKYQPSKFRIIHSTCECYLFELKYVGITYLANTCRG